MSPLVCQFMNSSWGIMNTCINFPEWHIWQYIIESFEASYCRSESEQKSYLLCFWYTLWRIGLWCVGSRVWLYGYSAMSVSRIGFVVVGLRNLLWKRNVLFPNANFSLHLQLSCVAFFTLFQWLLRWHSSPLLSGRQAASVAHWDSVSPSVLPLGHAGNPQTSHTFLAVVAVEGWRCCLAPQQRGAPVWRRGK